MALQMSSENRQSQDRETCAGSSFQMPDAVDEKHFEVAIDDLLSGADMFVEKDQSDREGILEEFEQGTMAAGDICVTTRARVFFS